MTYKEQTKETLTRAQAEATDLLAFLKEPAIVDEDGVVRMGSLLQAQESIGRLQAALLHLQRATHGRDMTVGDSASPAPLRPADPDLEEHITAARAEVGPDSGGLQGSCRE